MKMKWLAVTAAIAAIALPSYSAFAQWDESEEQQRLEDQETDETLYEDSTAVDHERQLHMPKKKQGKWQPPPQPGTYQTPAEQVQGTTRE